MNTRNLMNHSFKRMAANILSIFAILAIAFPVTGSAYAQDSAPKVGLVLNAFATQDNDFNWMAEQGLLRAETYLGISSLVYQPANQGEYNVVLQQCADANNLCIAVGFDYGVSLANAARAYPATKWVIVDYSYPDCWEGAVEGVDCGSFTELPNVRGLRFDEKQAGYLAGVLAGEMTASNTVGVVGGMEIPPVVAFVEGYRNGAQCTNPAVNVLTNYTGTFGDPDIGAATAKNMIVHGADVIFGAAGLTGNGAILFSAQNDHWAIGVDTDQYVTVFGNGSIPGSNKLLSSAMKRVDNAVYQTIEDYVNGEFTSGTVVYNLAMDGVGLAPFHATESSIPQEVKEELDAVKQGIIDGTVNIDVSCRFSLKIRAYIDGYSQLVIQGSDVYWHHIGAAAPGRLDLVNLPTYLNGDAWYPNWPDIPNAENRECNCDSITKFSLDTSLPENQSFVLNKIEARNSARISQQPNADNNYTLIIDFDDWPPAGAAWYEVTVSTYTPLPWLIAFPENDAVEGWEWPEGATVKLTVNDTTDPDWSGVSNVTTWGDPRTYLRIEFGADFNLQIGDVVELTDGMTTITHTVKNLAVLDANQDNEFISGTADAGETVSVWPHGHDQEATVQETVGEDGHWQADFTSLFNLVIGTCGRSQIMDESGNATAVDWCAPKPWFAVFPEWDVYVQAFDYPFGATVHLAIDDPVTELSPDFEADQVTEVMPWNQNGAWAIFSLPPDYDMKPGDIVTLTSDGISPRIHTVQNLSVDMVNVKYDTISGTADTGAVVQVWPWGYEQDYTVEANAQNGKWQVDYAVLGFDVTEGINGRAQITINGNVTAMDWDAHQSFDIYAFNTQTRAIQQVTYLGNTDEYNPSWSPNGKKVAHDVVRWNGAQGIYITDVVTGKSSPLMGAQDGGNDAVWSPNGKWIVFDRAPVGDLSLYLIPATGGTPIHVRSNAVSADWAPSGKRLVFQDTTDGSVRTVAVDGGKGAETAIAPFGMNPVWSLDGNWIAYENSGDIWKVRVNVQGRTSGDPTQVTSSQFWDGQPTWSPDSTTIIYHSGFNSDWDLWSIPAAGGTGTWLNGAPDVGDYDPSFAKNSSNVAYAGFSPDGQAARLWIAAFTNDPSAGTLKGGTHPYHYELEWSTPESGNWTGQGGEFVIADNAEVYDGYVLLRGLAEIHGINYPSGLTCEPVGDINPSQPTRFLVGWLPDYGEITYADAKAHFASITATAVWDDGSAVLMQHEIIPYRPADWPSYVCTFTESTLWRDEFDTEILDPIWYWENGDSGEWSLKEQPGFLKIYTSKTPTSDGNLLLRPATQGDFRIETRVLFEPDTNFQFAGLVIYQDDDNFLQFGRAFCDIEGPCVGNGIYFDKVLGGSGVDDNFATLVNNLSEAYLRLERQGNTVTAFYSSDGVTWVEIGTHEIPAGFQVNGVGLTASQDYFTPGSDIPADFDYFEIVELP